MHLKHILRRLIRTPMFTLTTVVTLAIGIGANAAIFSVIDGVLIKPLPIPDSGNLVALWQSAPGINLRDLNASAADYFTYREESTSFTGVGLWNQCASSVTGTGEPERVNCYMVTDGTLPLLGASPILGRLFTREDDAPGAAATAVLSYGYWQRRFGGDTGVIGRSIITNGKSRQIIGVLPQDFWFRDWDASLYLPRQLDRSEVTLGNYNYQGIGRLKPGVTLAQASADVARMIPIEQRKFPVFPGTSLKMFQGAGFAPNLRLLKQDVLGDIGNTLWVLMATIGIVLLIACANVANLLLVRAEGRHQELAIRAALGAGWGRIARDLLLESLGLAAAGGVAGLAVAEGALRLLKMLGPAQLPRLNQLSIDLRVVLFTVAVSLLAGLIFGMIPVLKYAGPHLALALRGVRTSSHSRERHRARNTLVVVQVALAMVLLVGSGLMIRTFQAMRHVDPGIKDPASLETLSISVPQTMEPNAEKATRIYEDILHRLEAIPQVASVSFTDTPPMTGNRSQDLVFAQDRVYREGELAPLRRMVRVAPGYFQTMGAHLVAGRDLTWTDLYQNRRSVLVSENFAREYWGGTQAAIGKRLHRSSTEPWSEIVGVTSDLRQDGVDQKAPTILYMPTISLDPAEKKPPEASQFVTFVIRSARAGSEGFLNQVRQAVWAGNANIPVAQLQTFETIYDRSMARTSFTLTMLALAGGMALLLGVVGIYAVMSYGVSQRTREIGIRLALGAQQAQLKSMFVRHGLILVSIGIAAGCLAAAGLSRLMSALLFEISPLDPLTYLAVPLLLLLAATLASYLPARRVTAVDPVEALRAE